MTREALLEALDTHIYQPRWASPSGVLTDAGVFPACLCGWTDITTSHVDRSTWKTHWVDQVLGEDS